jgi:rare lipoprotein A
MLQKQSKYLLPDSIRNDERIATQQQSNRSAAVGILKKLLRLSLLVALIIAFTNSSIHGNDSVSKKSSARILYGTASFYANSFQGKKTANGESFDQKKLTAACNVLPLGTWIRVTNLRNKRSVVVKINDRLHSRMTRIVDLSRVAATQLGYISSGLTRVKVEVLGKKKPFQ